jgi:Domain of unknown function (DUF4410)
LDGKRGRIFRDGTLATSLAASLVILTGCPTPRTGAPDGATIAVQEFDIPRTATVERYSGPSTQVGMKFAELLVERLNHFGYKATAVPLGTQLEGDFRITGHILEVDGGNAAKRILVGFAAGRSEFDVIGTVTRADGMIVGEFTESRAGGGWTENGALENAMQRTINMIGRMVYTGNYQCNAPANRPAAVAYRDGVNPAEPAAASAQPSAEERLHALDRLRADGLVTPEEYETKRTEILNAL